MIATFKTIYEYKGRIIRTKSTGKGYKSVVWEDEAAHKEGQPLYATRTCQSPLVAQMLAEDWINGK